ncbi:MAG: serine protease [Planctomycetes bacterium]|nr:serine protease [Planctomycetota bacterium]
MQRHGLAIALMILAGFLGGLALPARADDRLPPRNQILSEAFRGVATRLAPSVVRVLGPEEQGYGLVIAEGILTNDRLLGSLAVGSSITVETADGDTTDARVLGRHGLLDVALLDAGGVTAPRSPLGDSGSLLPGDLLVAVGTEVEPLAVGVVSALGRTVPDDRKTGPVHPLEFLGRPQGTPLRRYKRVIQHDLKLKPGTFGSPLATLDGQVVGINVASLHRGMSFGTPTSLVGEFLGPLAGGLTVAPPPTVERPHQDPFGAMEKVIERFFGKNRGREGPRRQRPGEPPAPNDDDREDPGETFLGVRPAPEEGTAGSGVLVGEVLVGQPAEDAGLRRGDVILSVGGIPTPDADALYHAVSAFGPGEEVEVRLTRLNELSVPEELSLRATLGRRQGYR